MAHSKFNRTSESQSLFCETLKTYCFGCPYILLSTHMMQKTRESFAGRNISKLLRLEVSCNLISDLIQSVCLSSFSMTAPSISANTTALSTHSLSPTHRTSARFHTKQQEVTSVLLVHGTLFKVTVKHGFAPHIVSVCNSLGHAVFILQI